jgi:multidrug transporter EmrE-like cation transporter
MNRLKRLGQSRLLDVGAVAVTLLLLSRWVVILPTRWCDYDFNHYYVGSRMLLEGQNPYTTSLEGMSQALGFTFSEQLPIAGYPPSFLWLLMPLVVLPPQIAYAVWVSVEIGSLILILRLTRRLLGERLSARAWLFVAALTITSRTVTYHLLFSQVQLLLAALVFAAYAAHRAGKHAWAILAVSTAGVLKFYPFFLLPWFIWSSGGGIRARLYRVLGVIGFVLAVVALTGPALWRDFIHHGMPAAVGEEIGRTFNFSLSAMVTTLGYAHHNFHPSPAAKQWWWAIGTMTGLAVIAGAYRVCVVARRDSEGQFCLLCVAMLIGTVTVQGHYFIFLVFPLTVAAVRIAARPTPAFVIGFILVVLAVNWINPPDFLWRHSIWYLFGNDIPLYGLIGLGAFFWRELTLGPVGCERRTGSDGAITGGNRPGNRTGLAGLRG